MPTILAGPKLFGQRVSLSLWQSQKQILPRTRRGFRIKVSPFRKQLRKGLSPGHGSVHVLAQLQERGFGVTMETNNY